MNLNLLLVEDDAGFAAALADELRGLEHRVTIAADGRDALFAVDRDQFDAVLLGRLLQHPKAIPVVEALRSANRTLPVILIGTLGTTAEKVEGLDAGADDCVIRMVSAAELNARLRALLRARTWTFASADTLRAGDIVVSPSQFRAWRGGKAIDLAKLEISLLAELARNADSVLTRAMLIQRVWGYDVAPGTNIVDVHIRRLRLKLVADGRDDPIVTVRGIGYMLRG